VEEKKGGGLPPFLFSFSFFFLWRGKEAEKREIGRNRQNIRTRKKAGETGRGKRTKKEARNEDDKEGESRGEARTTEDTAHRVGAPNDKQDQNTEYESTEIKTEPRITMMGELRRKRRARDP